MRECVFQFTSKSILWRVRLLLPLVVLAARSFGWISVFAREHEYFRLMLGSRNLYVRTTDVKRKREKEGEKKKKNEE